MSPPETDADQAFSEARDALMSAYNLAVEAIEALEVGQQSFDHATELANDLRRLADEAARLRAKAAVRIRDSEQLSLAGLAQRLSVSRARADQMVRAASAKPKQEEE